MATENYQTCLEMILHHEGGYVNHPEDPGGETNPVSYTHLRAHET